MRTLQTAYDKASSQTDIDDEVAYMERHGWLKPNGFRPVSPLNIFEAEGLFHGVENEVRYH